jgi:hypothetical protein
MQRKIQAPVDIQWLFRPNEFFIGSLRDHSVLSLLWVLSALRERARQSLIFIGPTSLGFSGQSQNSDAEVDLLALVDGQAITVRGQVIMAWPTERRHSRLCKSRAATTAR